MAHAHGMITMHSASAPIFTKMLKNARVWLDKAVAHAEAKKYDVNVLLHARLAPDMFALTKQIQESTAGMVAFFQESRGAFRLFNRLMHGLHWFIRKVFFRLALIVAAIWALTHDGRPPEWLKSWIDLLK